MLSRINQIRADAKVPAIRYSNSSELAALTLAQNCSLSAQKGEIIGPAFYNNSGIIPSVEQATNHAIDAWNNEAHTADPTKSPNYSQIIAKDATVFGCGFTYASCNGGKRYLHCFFGEWNEAEWNEGGVPSGVA